MNASSKLLLYRCFWLAELMLQPTIRNATTSFGDWALRNGVWRTLERLEAQQMLEITGKGGPRTERVVKLTELGRRTALGGVLPPELWNRGWDGKWRLLVFDIPEAERAKRAELRKSLRALRFGALQLSVWISPDPLHTVAAAIQSKVADCGVLSAFEGPPCFGETPAAIAASAWDFDSLAEAYGKWRDHADSLTETAGRTSHSALVDWGNRERELWQTCLALDPFLPRPLWPAGYDGESHWNHRLKRLAEAAKIWDP